jgi:hypothetical protein
VLLFQEMDLCSEIFLFCNFSLFFWLCASFMPLGYDVVAEAGCNWYIHDINICSLSKNLLLCKVPLLLCILEVYVFFTSFDDCLLSSTYQ